MRASCIIGSAGAFSEPLDLGFLFGLEEGRQLLLGHVFLPSLQELQDGGEVGKGNILQDDYRVLGKALIHQVLEVERASA